MTAWSHVWIRNWLLCVWTCVAAKHPQLKQANISRHRLVVTTTEVLQKGKPNFPHDCVSWTFFLKTCQLSFCFLEFSFFHLVSKQKINYFTSNLIVFFSLSTSFDISLKSLWWDLSAEKIFESEDRKIWSKKPFFGCEFLKGKLTKNWHNFCSILKQLKLEGGHKAWDCFCRRKNIRSNMF